MATMKIATVVNGKLVYGDAHPLPLITLDAAPEPPMPDLKVPVVTVHDFDGLITPDDWDMSWDDGNGTITHIYTKNRGLYVQVTNNAGTGQTGKYRRVV